MTDKSGGMDRREFIRRSAIVGGTVAWMTPVIQSLTPPAYAHVTPASTASCCQCTCATATGNCGQGPFFNACGTGATETSSGSACETFCRDTCGGASKKCGQNLNSGAAHGYQCVDGNCVAQSH